MPVALGRTSNRLKAWAFVGPTHITLCAHHRNSHRVDPFHRLTTIENAHGLFGWVVEVQTHRSSYWLSADYEARLLRCSAATP